MCAFSSLFPHFGWPLEDPISHHQQNHYNYRGDFEIEEPVFDDQFPLPLQQQEVQIDRCASFSTGNSCDPGMVKKLSHNASERNRRKKINSLYSSLRSLLPPEDQMKKLSIPQTVSRVLKYIPDLQQQVEGLIQKKEELLSKISKQDDFINVHEKKQRKNIVGSSSLSTFSASRLSENEVVIQISTFKLHQSSLSNILLNLEEDGLFLISASSFESSGERVFYNLHLQVEGSYKLDCDVLGEKLLSVYEKRQQLLP